MALFARSGVTLVARSLQCLAEHEEEVSLIEFTPGELLGISSVILHPGLRQFLGKA